MHRRGRIIPVVGASATLLVHVMLLTPALWGGSATKPPRQPEAVGAAANAGSPQGSATEHLILIDLMAAAPSLLESPQPANLAQLASAPTLLQILGPDSLPLKPLVVDPQGESNTANAVDLISRTQLMGIYEGQIRARIERAWRRPRTALADRQFNCRIKVHQDARGNVLSVKLQECEGTPDWFDSMVHAVKAASPLPAPPNPAVFAETFQMSFHAVSYQQGGSEEGFEPARPTLIAAAMPMGSSAEASSLPERSVMPATGDVILRGEGNRVEWSSATPGESSPTH